MTLFDTALLAVILGATAGPSPAVVPLVIAVLTANPEHWVVCVSLCLSHTNGHALSA